MRFFLLILSLSAFIACKQNGKQEEQVISNPESIQHDSLKTPTETEVEPITSIETIELIKPTIVVIEMDSIALETEKNLDEVRFYTATDDLLWYNHMVSEKMDTLGVPMLYYNLDELRIVTHVDTLTVTRDSTFGFMTYFYFDGNEIMRSDVFGLLGEVPAE